jgi:aminoglycoside 3-N-acetyltransferase
VTWTEVQPDESVFPELGEAFDKTGAVTVGTVGEATARLMSQRAVVDFATQWLAVNRRAA